MSYITSIGERVRKHRLIKGLSQDELGKRSNLSPGHISEIENGVRKSIQARTVKKLARGLEVNIAELFGEDEDSDDGGYANSDCKGSQRECAGASCKEGGVDARTTGSDGALSGSVAGKRDS